MPCCALAVEPTPKTKRPKTKSAAARSFIRFIRPMTIYAAAPEPRHAAKRKRGAKRVAASPGAEGFQADP
jgi:hypothetical protein